MRILSWLGAFILFVAVAAGTGAVLRHPGNTPELTPSALAWIASSGSAGSAGGPSRLASTPRVSPSPTYPTAKPKPKPAPAAPVPLKAAPVTRSTAPSISVLSTQQALINQDRARYGLRPLTWSSCLASIAYSNAVRMANQGYISHTNGPIRDLGCRLGNHAGENVAWYSAGPSDSWANNAFMASSDHRANILSPYYRYVATSWVRGANGKAYIAVEFS
jgi:uncharacterized protein YkwD